MPLALRRNQQREPGERKRLFRKALALAEMTAAEWAVAHGVGPNYLSRFLSGKTVSQPLSDAVEAFIAQKLPKRLRDVA